MSLSGHMIIKNGIKYDYPFIESCLSILPICNEFVFIEGSGEDGTYESLLNLQKEHNKIKIYRLPWEKQHYSVMADLTNEAIERCGCKYHFQIQADEVLHERYHKEILRLIDNNVDFIEMGIYHFYGSFRKVYKPGVFYDSFIRLAKRSTYPKLRSCGDAMSLGCPDSDSGQLSKIIAHQVKMHHYGYVRKPKALIEKQDEAVKWWGIMERDALFEKGLERGNIVWSDKHSDDKLEDYRYTHPKVLLNWIKDREEMVETGRLS